MQLVYGMAYKMLILRKGISQTHQSLVIKFPGKIFRTGRSKRLFAKYYR